MCVPQCSGVRAADRMTLSVQTIPLASSVTSVSQLRSNNVYKEFITVPDT